MNIEFHPAQERDIPLICDLAHEIWYDHYPSIISKAQIAYMLELMYSEKVVREQLQSPAYGWYLIYLDRQAIGFFSIETGKEPNALFLSKLYVCKKNHGQGVGQMALGYIKVQAMLKNCKSVFLLVNKENKLAIQAYERAGFVREKAICKDIGGGFVMDDYIMRQPVK